MGIPERPGMPSNPSKIGGTGAQHGARAERETCRCHRGNRMVPTESRGGRRPCRLRDRRGRAPVRHALACRNVDRRYASLREGAPHLVRGAVPPTSTPCHARRDRTGLAGHPRYRRLRMAYRYADRAGRTRERERGCGSPSAACRSRVLGGRPGASAAAVVGPSPGTSSFPSPADRPTGGSSGGRRCPRSDRVLLPTGPASGRRGRPDGAAPVHLRRCRLLPGRHLLQRGRAKRLLRGRWGSGLPRGLDVLRRLPARRGAPVLHPRGQIGGRSR
ncbi:hypothetical protein EKD16_18555 [Streptomonospora litoralis]|uniref:Uncharacterized protein n=1 Tax=Streptomonospora litoralis TaxID=2498135 RepID=A0A4P6Q4A5_9ACTN|nr:hypothetical protein EKD16_18555 [Streptomonospora litoralis]